LFANEIITLLKERVRPMLGNCSCGHHHHHRHYHVWVADTSIV